MDIDSKDYGDLPEELQGFLQNLEVEKRTEIEALFETAINASQGRSISDLWEQPELASSFWILIVSGLDDKLESSITDSLLRWKAFSVRDSAMLLCFQSSDRDAFSCCGRHCNIQGCPTLLLSDSPEMQNYIRFDPQFFVPFLEKPGAFHRLVTFIHNNLERGTEIAELTNELKEGNAWQDLQISESDVVDHVWSPTNTVDTFDVFLSHNSKDKPTVRRLAKALKARGLRVWLDQWELVPGRPWQQALEKIVEEVPAALVLVGPEGLGPWEVPEMRGCLSEYVERGMPVIPVVLPGVTEFPELPLFLKQFTWVDLRNGITKKNLDLLEWGVTGRNVESA